MRIIEADGHVVGPVDLWDRHAPPRFRDAAPRVVIDEDGYARYRLEGRLTPRLPFMKVAGERPPFVPPAGGTDPVARLADLDREGIFAAVLYPSTGLLLAGVENPLAAVALCRAYNDWLAAYCATAPARLLGVAAVPLQDPAAAAAEALRLGFRAVFVRPHPRARPPPAHPPHGRLWGRCAEAGVPGAGHRGTPPNGPPGGGG